MKRIEIKLSIDVVAPLLDTIRDAGDSLVDHLAVQQAPLRGVDGGEDAEMASIWRDTLMASQRADIAALMELFGEDFFATGIVSLDAGNGGRVIRACSALRLQIRARFLGDVSDQSLEHGIGDLDTLSESARRGMMSYLFLATIQDLVIQHLASSILGGE